MSEDLSETPVAAPEADASPSASWARAAAMGGLASLLAACAAPGGRLGRVIDRVADEEAFCLTYGDGVSDIDIGASIAFHKAHGKLATVSAMLPPRRFGILELEGDKVLRFTEKPKADGSHINGGFFVLSPKVADYLGDDTTVWEQEPLMGLANDGQLHAWQHDGFFQPMDTLRDKAYLEELWADGQAPWKKW